MLDNDRDLPEKMEKENASKPFGDRLGQEEGPGRRNTSEKILVIFLWTNVARISYFIAYSPRLNRVKHYQDSGQNSGRLSPSGSLISGRSSPGAKKARTLPGLPAGNQPSGKQKN